MLKSRLFVWLFGTAVIFFTGQTEGHQDITESAASNRYQNYLASIMEIADANNDGKIDKEEVSRNYHIVAASSDLNGDGVITGRELLDSVVGKKTQNPLNVQTGNPVRQKIPLPSRRLSVTVLKLPSSYLKSNVISINDVLRKLSVKQKEGQEKDDADDVSLLDQFDLQLIHGRRTKLSLGATASRVTGKVTRNGRTTATRSNVSLGSTIIVTPEFNEKKALNLAVALDSNYLLQSSNVGRTGEDERDSEKTDLVGVKVDTELQFDDKKSISTLKMLVSGYHILVLFKIEAT